MQGRAVPIGPDVVPFCGLYLESYKVIPKRNIWVISKILAQTFSGALAADPGTVKTMPQEGSGLGSKGAYQDPPGTLKLGYMVPN